MRHLREQIEANSRRLQDVQSKIVDEMNDALTQSKAGQAIMKRIETIRKQSLQQVAPLRALACTDVGDRKL